jgi:hypothetical protein
LTGRTQFSHASTEVKRGEIFSKSGALFMKGHLFYSGMALRIASPSVINTAFTLTHGFTKVVERCLSRI